MESSITNTLDILYPASYPGTAKTKVSFYAQTPDLLPIYGKESAERRCFVTDATVATLDCMKSFINRFEDGACGKDILIILGSGEPYKTIESVLTITQTALEAGFSRNDLFVGIGGGVICDLTGFAASVYKRGIRVQFVPTTLLSMVDASIGGKTGCDFQNYKNMLGAFWPAEEIHVFPKFVQTLSKAQYRSGLAEAIKTGLIYDKELYEIFKQKSEELIDRNPDTVLEIIIKSAKAKSEIVKQDFTEQNIRAYLNFGHTFGHALETLAGLGNITHGDAVAWGIGRAICLSARKEFCSEQYKDEVLSVLQKYGWCTSAIHPLVLGGGIGERLIAVMHKDKKNKNDTIRLILQNGLAQTFIQETDDKDILAILK